MNSVADASEKEQNLISKANELCKIIQDKLMNMKSEIE